MPDQNIQFYFTQLTDALLPLYPRREAESIAYIAVEHVLNYSKYEYATNKHIPFPESHLFKWNEIKERLEGGEPIQYVVNEAVFYGLKLLVTSSVLIPRPETEELVDLIIKENPADRISMIDIGTGSGCIPVSIKVNRKNWEVWALDISADALAVAEKNAQNNNVQVNLVEDNILNPGKTYSEYDVIISNPPYVPFSDIKNMHKNVVGFEPHLALFSPDKDPVKFYKAIAGFAMKYLKKQGKVYVEIHEKYGDEVKKIFLQKGLNTVHIISDINNKPRIIKAVK